MNYILEADNTEIVEMIIKRFREMRLLEMNKGMFGILSAAMMGSMEYGVLNKNMD